ncbi:unnamed protein product [Protopolystoma xenopodis]|uniref:Uncharacterized protein n=1 Tax=Protopolystoma xenopodis TaxID=117903 RepID=A0A3S5AG57_9PLAT|nr:unnamed protein product [Protopolystoma xenopodis]
MFSRGREFDPSIHQSTSAAHAASIKRRIKAGGAGKGRGGRKGGRSAIRRGPKARRAQRHQKDQARRR